MMYEHFHYAAQAVEVICILKTRHTQVMKQFQKFVTSSKQVDVKSIMSGPLR
jgi:uncharacterized protein YjlB